MMSVEKNSCEWKPNKITNIEKIFDFNKQQKGNGLKILTPKQMLQRLPIALA